MPRRAAAEAAVQPTPSLRRGAEILAYFVTLLVSVVAFIYLYNTTEQFLISDDRFILHGPPEPGVASEFFKVEGTVNASDQQIAQVFLRDFGRSIYLCPIQERRRRLLGIDWIKDAVVKRIWPNRLVVTVTERKPVAFAQRQAVDGASMYALIDADGVLLDPQRAGKLPLPVLVGLPPGDTEAKRRDRVRRFLRMQSELGSRMAKISEIDVSDPDNLRIVMPFDRRAVTLMLGNQDYRERLDKFLNNMEEIRQRMPGATKMDLRLKGRIIEIGEPRIGEPR
jgi:cell division protein FtsQ